MNLKKRFPFFWHTDVAICTESQKARHFLSKHALVRTDDSQTELHHWNRRSEPGTPGAELKEENLPSVFCFHT